MDTGQAMLAVLPLLGFAAGFLSGFLGLGGAVVMLPLLTYVGGVPLKLATGTSLVHVLIAAATGTFLHHRSGMVDTKLGWTVGFAGVAGGMAGSFLSDILSPKNLEFIFLTIIGLAILLLFIPMAYDSEGYRKGVFNKPMAVVIGCGVGSLTGLLGAGGGFILIPFMIHILKIPLRVAIGTSLLIILVTSLGTIWAKFNIGHIRIEITALVLIGSVIGTILGSHYSRRTQVRSLRFILIATLILILLVTGYSLFPREG